MDMEEDGVAEAAPARRRRGRRLFDARAEAAVARALRGGASFAAAAKAAGFGVSTVYGAKARSASFRALCEAAVEESDGEVAIAPGKGRRLQFRRVRRRRFGTKLKDAFLEHFAATCSIAASAEAIGVGRSTVNKHLAEDEDFRARFDRTLEIAYRQLDSELVRQRIEAAARPQVDGGGGPEAAAEFDRSVQLLREHRRGLARSGPGPRGSERRVMPRVATNEEVKAALVKALRAHGIRVRAARDGEGGGG
jgi:hypothetical protein